MIPDPFLVCTLTGLLNLVPLWMLKKRIWPVVFIAAAVFCLPFSGIHQKTAALLFKGLLLQKEKASHYGLIRVFSNKGEKVLMENDDFISFKSNPAFAEELAHLPLLQMENAGKVLLVCGGLSGIIQEVQKHHPERIDYVEQDPAVLQVGQEENLLPRARNICLIKADAREYIEGTREKYSAVILAVPPPSTLAHQRYFTDEFFSALKQRLVESGVIALPLPPVEDYIGPEREAYFSCLKSTLLRHFRDVRFFPGLQTVVVASDREIRQDIGALISARGLQTAFLNQDYLRGYYTPFQTLAFSRISGAGRINRDFHPFLFLSEQRLFFREFGFKAGWVVLPVVLILVFFLFFTGRRPYVIFSTGLSATGAHVFLITAFAVHFGTLYYSMSILFSLFLLGLAAGYLTGQKTRLRLSPLAVEAGLMAVVAASLLSITKIGGVCIAPLILALAALTGFQFSSLFREEPEAFGRLFGADVLGGALGALITGCFLFPLAGPLGTVLTLLSVKILSFIWTVMTHEKTSPAS